MNASHRLRKLSTAAKGRIARIRFRAKQLSLPATPDKDVVAGWAVIESLNVWAGFLRAYYLSGAIRTRTVSGVRITFTAAAFPSSQAALIFAVKKLKTKHFSKPVVSRRDEPAWHNSKDIRALLRGLGVSNLPQVYAAFSYSTKFFDFLPTIRNFYAHRCDETFRKAALIGVRLGLTATPQLRPTEIMCSKLSKRPENVLTDWLDDMASVIDLLCS